MPSATWAGCEGEPKHVSSFYWLGNANRERFEDETRALFAHVVPRSEKAYVALGGMELEKKFVPAWRPSPLPKNTTLYDAKPDALAKIAGAVSEEVQALSKADPNFKPSDYQFNMVISNHGTDSVGNVIVFGGKRRFGLVGMPFWNEVGKYWDYADVSEEDLKNFAKSLPKGIRFKYRFGQCYASDALAAFQAGIENEDPGCSCGSTGATIGRPSLGGNIQSALLARAATTTPAEARGELVTDRIKQGDKYLSPQWLTSELVYMNYFQGKAKAFGLEPYATGDQIEDTAPTIYEKAIASHPTLTPEDQKLLRAERGALAERYGMAKTPEAEWDKIIQKGWELRAAKGETTDRWRSYDALGHPILGPAAKKFTTDQSLVQILNAESDLTRLQLLEAFLRTAPDDLKKRYLAYRECEMKAYFFPNEKAPKRKYRRGRNHR